MINSNQFDVIIVGGSYAGLSAAMALGRSLRNVLILDSGKPCNRQTPHSHNFITQDGETPASIAEKAKAQVLQYDTVKFYNGLATTASKTKDGFEVRTANDDCFFSKKLLFTSGVRDVMPAIQGFAECWGISALHCPYCHGYEVKQEPIAVIGNGDMGFEFSRLISNWTKKLVLLTNGKSILTEEQTRKLKSNNINIIEAGIVAFEHENGYLQNVILQDQSKEPVTAVFSKVGFDQHCAIPQQLGCELTDQGFIKIDDFQRTTVPGIFAAGDNTTMFRTVSMAVAAGTKAGAMLNKELVDESF
jgi:thioredoxin reductase